ncbi:MAG: single-stranded-DNA-specific exonuclease RecJ [Oceanicola sp.]|nr:single-stranded-DNA-specific exonuclease RecJ [Oceanicola sp.]
MTAGGELPAFLGVEASLTGRRWCGPNLQLERSTEALVQATDLPAPLCAVLAQRGVPATQVDSFLAPALRDLLPDPRSLRDMEDAARIWLEAAQSGKRIAVFADYDVDGGSSAALLIDWLRQVGAPAPTLYVPDRIDEGYGPNAPAIQSLAQSHDLIVCVDCGTLSHDALAAAAPVPVLVLDHHLGADTLPDVAAVVNPNRQDEDGSLGHLCAAAVVFLMLVEAGRQMREAGQRGPDLLKMLDLVALATVADVAPLKGVNRAFVRQGLQVMRGRERPGLTALSEVAAINTPPEAYHLGFLLGPRVNAGGRVGKADLGARLLATASPDEASALAERLDLLNKERREIEASVTQQARTQAEERDPQAALIWAAGDDWHPGVVGIVAARLKEAYNRPAVVIGFDAEGTGKGSGRSVSGVDLGAAIQAMALDGQIEKGGGHRMAAGLTLTRDQLAPAMAHLSAHLARQGAHLRGPNDLHLTAPLFPAAVTPELIEQVERAGPFGASAPAPRFALPDLSVLNARRVGEDHLKLSIGDRGGHRLDAICFGAFRTALGEALANAGSARFHFAGRLELNAWGGRVSPQLRLEDAAPA